MKADKQATTATGKPRGPYNVACDSCAQRKIKCTGGKPLCQPCQSRQNECTWSKNSSRKPRTAAYVKAMRKRMENLRQVVAGYSNYADRLESLLDQDEYNQRHPDMVDFRASRPSNSESLTDAVLDRDSDFVMGGDDNDQDSDDGHLEDPIVMAISIPPESLLIEPFIQPSRLPALAENPIHSTDPEVDHVKHCRCAADNIMDLLSTWRTLYTLRYCSSTLIQTVGILLLTATRALSGTCFAQKELRYSYDQATLTLQYLDEIRKTWPCAAKVTETPRSLTNEELGPHVERILAFTAGPPISGDMSDDEEESGPRPSGSLSQTSQTMNSHRVAHSNSRTRSFGSGQSSISTSPNPPSNFTPVPAQVSSSAQLLTSPTITISPRPSFGPSTFPDLWSPQPTFSTNHSPSFAITIPPAHDPSAATAILSPRPSSSASTFPDSWSLQPNLSTNHSSSFTITIPPAHDPSAAIAIRSPRPSSDPSTFPDSWSLQSNFSTDHFSSFMHLVRDYAFSNYIDDSFSGNGNGISDHVGHPFGSQDLFSAHFQSSLGQSSMSRHYPGMLGGQTIPERPFFGPFSEAYTQPFFNYIDNLFSGNVDGSSDDVGHPFESQGSFSAPNFQSSLGPSSMNRHYLGMLGGQMLSETPFFGLFSEADTNNPPFPSLLQAPAGTGFSQADADNMPSDSFAS